MSAPRRAVTDERGFALLAVILVLALLSVVVTEFAFSMRLEASMVRAYRDTVLGRNLAEAAVEQATREILSDSNVHAIDDNGQLVFYTLPAGGTVAKALPMLSRSHVALGAGEFSYRIADEESRLNLNSGAPDRMQRLLLALGVDRIERDTIVDSIEDWRDANDTVRTNGAESDDYYLKLPVPYRARNGNLQDTSELLQIKGVTPELYHGHDDTPGLEDFVTTWGRGTININTAPPQVLSAFGLSDAEISDIVQTRTHTPYPTVPGRFGGRRVTVGTGTFRIEAEGAISGDTKARIIAIVQKTSAAGGAPSATIVSWRPQPPHRPVRAETEKPS